MPSVRHRQWELRASGPPRGRREQPNDAIIALCMALEAMENQPEPVELIARL
jgi:hypothetical protein